MDGVNGINGKDGRNGKNGEDGKAGRDGVDGKVVGCEKRNWKECAWSQLNDSKDRGVLNVLKVK